MHEPRRKSPSTAGIALGTVVLASAAPYGFTVSLWSSGALLIHFRGNPNVGDVFLAKVATNRLSLVGYVVRHCHPDGPGFKIGAELSGFVAGGEPERVMKDLLNTG